MDANWSNELQTGLTAMLPECILVLGMCVVILVPLFARQNAKMPIGVGFGTLVLALLAQTFTLSDDQAVFYGMLHVDAFSFFFKSILYLFTILVLVQWRVVGNKNISDKDIPDMLCLVLGATFGMSLMASASNLLMMFMAIESASLPSYVLAGLRKRNKVGSEGSLKYVIFGSASSAIMVYGMSLVYGTTGTLDFSGVATAAAAGISPMMAIGLMAMLAGVAFKLSAVPLHFWCPDVFQGAPIEITTFLSVASKGAAICLLVRFLNAFGIAGSSIEGVSPNAFAGLTTGIGILGAVTATWGNLVALHQTNIKRLLAYSSIAHAGYMLMAVAVLPLAERAGIEVTSGEVAMGILFYLLVYTFMNLGAFTVAAVVARRTGSEEIEDYTGLLSRSTGLSILMFIFLMSLFGMPGFGGFLGKIYLASAMVKLGTGGFALLIVLLINTLFSLYYYMRPVYFMMLCKDEEERPSFVPQAPVMWLLGLCTAVVFWTGLNLLSISEKVSDYSGIYNPTLQVEEDAAADTDDANTEATTAVSKIENSAAASTAPVIASH